MAWIQLQAFFNAPLHSLKKGDLPFLARRILAYTAQLFLAFKAIHNLAFRVMIAGKALIQSLEIKKLRPKPEPLKQFKDHI